MRSCTRRVAGCHSKTFLLLLTLSAVVIIAELQLQLQQVTAKTWHSGCIGSASNFNVASRYDTLQEMFSTRSMCSAAVCQPES
jgi:hypothetical protein